MATSAARSFLVRQRSDSAFHTFYQSIVNEASDYTLSPVLPRQRKVPRRIDDGAPSHTFSSPEDYYRKQYYEVMDTEWPGGLIRLLSRFFRRWNGY